MEALALVGGEREDVFAHGGVLGGVHGDGSFVLLVASASVVVVSVDLLLSAFVVHHASVGVLADMRGQVARDLALARLDHLHHHSSRFFQCLWLDEGQDRRHAAGMGINLGF